MISNKWFLTEKMSLLEKKRKKRKAGWPFVMFRFLEFTYTVTMGKIEFTRFHIKKLLICYFITIKDKIKVICVLCLDLHLSTSYCNQLIFPQMLGSSLSGVFKGNTIFHINTLHLHFRELLSTREYVNVADVAGWRNKV